MRITDSITSSNAIYNINEGRIKLDRLNERIASGNNVSRPSDDPVATRKILEVETEIKTSNQYISNIKSGTTWLEMAGTSLEGLLSTVMSIRGTAGQALGALDDPVKKGEVLDQLRFMRDQLLDYPNVQVGSQYVFSGFKSNVAPFSATTVEPNITVGSFAISNIDTADLYVGLPISGPGIPANSTVASIPTPGAAGSITFTNSNTPPVAAGATTTTPRTLSYSGTFKGTSDIFNIDVNKTVQLPISVTGDTILRGGTPPGSEGIDIIKTLDTLIADVDSGNLAGIQAANVSFEQATQEMLGTISAVGMRKSRLENALQSQQRTYNILSTIRDDLQNVDMSAAAISLTNQKNAFEAALAATAKISPLSLLSYLQ
ncbi:MAG: flagellar hook-associated protein FlgL [Deltaproteobacteria bacterium]|nr:flagellar hook-associated protein FlgL [Deltaproteobacteria bacterium]